MPLIVGHSIYDAPKALRRNPSLPVFCEVPDRFRCQFFVKYNTPELMHNLDAKLLGDILAIARAIYLLPNAI